jgi:tRNA (mo5U34)-methyltransferase
MAFYPGRELNNDPTNWWGPNVPAVRGMLESLGFAQVTTPADSPTTAYRAARAFYHRLRKKNTLRAAFRQDRAVFHAQR